LVAGRVHRRKRVRSRSHGRSECRSVRPGAKMGPCIRGLGTRSQGQTGRAVAGRVDGAGVVVWTSDSQRLRVDGCRDRRLLHSSCRMSRSPQRIRARCYTLVVHGVNRLRLPTAARCEFHLFHQSVTWVGSTVSSRIPRMHRSECLSNRVRARPSLLAKEQVASCRGSRHRITFTDPYATV
jgi:hypothetical protein